MIFHGIVYAQYFIAFLFCTGMARSGILYRICEYAFEKSDSALCVGNIAVVLADVAGPLLLQMTVFEEFSVWGVLTM